MRRCLSLLVCCLLGAAVSQSNADGWETTMQAGGVLELRRDGVFMGKILPSVYELGWKCATLLPAEGEPDKGVYRGRLRCASGLFVDVQVTVRGQDEVKQLIYQLTPRGELSTNSLHVELAMPISRMAGGEYRVGGRSGRIPAKLGRTHLFLGEAREVQMVSPEGVALALRMAGKTQVLVQDSRQWEPILAVRAGTLSERTWQPNATVEYRVEVWLPDELPTETDEPEPVPEEPDWFPLDARLGIVPGSALDFSTMGLHHQPAGRYGRIIAGPDGHFAFSDDPGQPVRFYGVNLCYGANFLTSEQAERLAARLQRIGYNAIRIHHHERELIERSAALSRGVPAKPPARMMKLESFETVAGQGDDYTSWIRGHIWAPADGEYTFWIAADDMAELWLGGDGEEDMGRKIAEVPRQTGAREWDEFEEQESDPIPLTAGQCYCIAARHLQGVGADHLSVAWQPPGGPRDVIPGRHLSPFNNPPARGSITWQIWPNEPTDMTRLKPEAIEQLDCLLAACKRRGIYVSTDLFVSRPIPASAVWPGETGELRANDFKMLVPVNEKAFQNWCEFTRNLLSHTNPHTGLTWAEDPAVAWLVMINEGNPTNFLRQIKGKVRAEWEEAWNRFLRKRYKSPQALKKAWRNDNPDEQLPAGNVPLVTSLRGDGVRHRDMMVFLAETEAASFARMKAFVRDEMNCEALLSNCNGWTNWLYSQDARSEYDYVDDHFYVDHPRFLKRSWQLPSKCRNDNPVASGGPGGCSSAFLRIFGKPFTISEFNYAAPGRYRSVGGLMIGYLAALQNWDGVWRFAYSHRSGKLFEPSPMTYFDVVSDPLLLASERAALCLFLRGDMQPAPHRVALVAQSRDVAAGRISNVRAAPEWNRLARVIAVGLDMGPSESSVGLAARVAVGKETWGGDVGATVLGELRTKGLLKGNASDLEAAVLEAETAEALVDGPKGKMVVDTLRTAGGFAAAGTGFKTKFMKVRIGQTDAAVWASSLDDKPLPESGRILITHLTDLLNTGSLFADETRQVLLEWGGLPHLVCSGTATIELALNDPGAYTVWELAMDGTRVGKLEAEVVKDRLQFTASVRNRDSMARMLYEIAR